MDRCHDPVFDAEGFHQHFGDRREAVGGAGGVGNDLMSFQIENVVVDTQHDRNIRVLGRRRNDHVLRTSRNVFPRPFPIGKAAGRFDDDVNVKILPGQLFRIFDGKDFN